MIQQSITAASHRAHALSSTLNSTNVLTSMANMTLSKSESTKSRGEFFGMAGPFLVRRTFDELCSRCEGAVVFVSLLGNSGVIDLDNLQHANHLDGVGNSDYEDVRLKELNKRRNALRLFRQNGAVVDLASNPFGWDDEEQDSSDGFVTTSAINNLQSIADAIRAAAASVESNRPVQQHTPNQSADTQRPIPIIFDSLTPLLALHGAQNVSVLLQNFKKVASQQSILSPIIAPILYESISPSNHRLLEDMSDAFMSLQFRDDISKVDAIASGVLDVVRRGGGVLGGKLMRGIVPVHVMKASEDSKIRKTDLRDGYYWIMEYDASKEKKKQDVTLKAGDSKTNGKEDMKEAGQQKSRPRIYLEDNDPELIDFDEEDDIDDDLDL